MKNKKLSLKILTVISAAVLGAGMFGGCTRETGAGDADTEIIEETDSGDTEADGDSVEDEQEAQTIELDPGIVRPGEDSPDFNHGHSIRETEAERPREIARSYELLIHNADEALDYLEKNVSLQDGELSFMLVDTSDDDPGAYMWYEFMPSKDGIPVDGADFTVIAFADGTVVEGRSDFLTCSLAPVDGILSPEEALESFYASTGDPHEYVYQTEKWWFTGKGASECSYVYVYRYDCGDILENTTMYLDAATGGMIASWPDAIS